jgi:hypothetical protein
MTGKQSGTFDMMSPVATVRLTEKGCPTPKPMAKKIDAAITEKSAIRMKILLILWWKGV